MEFRETTLFHHVVYTITTQIDTSRRRLKMVKQLSIDSARREEMIHVSQNEKSRSSRVEKIFV